jgi:CRP-like cAMP-binding protein
MIDLNILTKNGGVIKHYSKNDLIFKESEQPRYYHQIVEGTVKMFNTTSEGKEFTQGHFTESESFGEPPLFIGEPYPASAKAVRDSKVIRLAKNIFLDLLQGNPELCMKFNCILARRIYNKSVTTRELINHNPEHRIIAFLEHYKSSQNSNGYKVIIPYTRQEIANFTGLRVETVIRTMSKLHEKGVLSIENRKVLF